jgi:glycosyltransferase involved in cell wall biosynthesis
VYPNKVFDYMACERPTVVGIDGIARDLVCEQAKAGLFAEPENGAALADAIVRLADDRILARRLALNGRQWVLEHFARAALARRYLTELSTLVESSSASTAGAPQVRNAA